ncbi:MAG: DUF1893 domain-containing protein [Candidatus Bathyarchaeia archaeon]
MENKDLEAAKRMLKEKNLTIAIVKQGEVLFESTSHGILGFLQAIEKLRDEMCGSSVADKVVGKAAALLCAYARVKAVYAQTLSEKARETLREHRIYHEEDILVKRILAANKNETCPFEKLATELTNPAEAYIKIKAFQEHLKTSG